MPLYKLIEREQGVELYKKEFSMPQEAHRYGP
jgi:hypothetical protein